MGDDAGQTRQRQNIERVVVEDGNQALNPLGTQVFEVDVRDHCPRNVSGSLKTQHLIFEVDQTAAVEAKLPEAARSVEQIKMRQETERRLGAIQAVARFEQGLIEGRAVIGDQHFKIFKMMRECVEQARFFAVAAHEELADSKAFF